MARAVPTPTIDAAIAIANMLMRSVFIALCPFTIWRKNTKQNFNLQAFRLIFFYFCQKTQPCGQLGQ
jgi:hypothetical protein